MRAISSAFTTVSVVMAVPSWKFTLSRRATVQVNLSPDIRQHRNGQQNESGNGWTEGLKYPALSLDHQYPAALRAFGDWRYGMFQVKGGTL